MDDFKYSYHLADAIRMLSRDEVDLIKKCVGMLKNDEPVIINIGASVGTGVIAMLEENPDMTIFSVDKKLCPDERKNIFKAKLPVNRVMRILGDSKYIGRFFPYPVDMVFVDGAHHDEAVKWDILSWRPKCIEGGIMIFHDYHHPNLPTLSPIVDNLMSDCKVIGTARYMIAFTVSNGQK